MARTDVRRIVFKLAVLALMIGAFFFYRSDTHAQFGSPSCDNDYQYCINNCMDSTGGTSSECGSGACATQYFACWQNENPPIGQPQQPCPPCLAECDFNQQQCIAGGTSTSTCAFLTYRCKQRCNYECIY